MKAAVINATNVSLSAVQAAVTSASPGDTVNVPAGSATWNNTLTINANIQLIGAGPGKTVIYDDVPRTSNSGAMILWTTSSNTFCRLSGFSFSQSSLMTTLAYNGSIQIGGGCHAFRLDHCSFTNLMNVSVRFTGWVYGCVDDNYFLCLETVEPINEQMESYGGANYNWGDDSWATPDTLGTTNCLCVENNIFIGPEDVGEDAYDGCAGARVIFRYNLCTNIIFGTHGTETTQRSRSIRTFEVYNNVFWWATNGNPVTDTPVPWAVYIRGGTGVIYSNQILNNIQYPMQMAAYRNWTGTWTPWGGVTGANGWDSNSSTIFAQGTANGGNGVSFCEDTTASWTVNQWNGAGYVVWDTNQNLASPISGNTANTISYLGGYQQNLNFNNNDHYQVRRVFQILDQPGVGQGDLLADAGKNGVFAPYDTVTGKTNWPNEAIDPIYQWGNTVVFHQDDASGNYGMADSPTVIQNYNWIDNSPRPGYTALIYPHPLDTTNGSSSPSTFTLTVVSGTGGGSYTNKAVVSITAYATTNQTFAYWNGLNIANTNRASTTVTMPNSNLTITADYAPFPPPSMQALPP